MRFGALLFGAVFLIACDTGPQSSPFPQGPGQQGVPPAGGTTVNALGQLCQTAAQCPSNHVCVSLSANASGNYCSPACNVATDCTAGLVGSFAGIPHCEVPNQPNACVIECNVAAAGQCPAGLVCKPSMGPLAFCATP